MFELRNVQSGQKLMSCRRSIRRPHTERLLKLLEQKQSIEASIEKCQADLEKAFESTSSQLQVAVDGRCDEVAN
jgi:ribosome recycling factor